MAEAVAAAVSFIATTGVEIAGFEFTTAQILMTVAAAGYVQDQQRKALNRQKDAYNNSLRDRYVMTRGSTQPRQLVLGRQRVSGPIFFIQSYGTNKEKLVFCLTLAAHEIDAVEAIYFDDEQVTLDGSGNVTGVNRREYFSISTSSSVFTLQGTPKSGSVSAVVKYGTTSVTLGTSVAGKDVTVTGASAGQTGTVTISYQPDPSPFSPAQSVNAQSSITTNGSGTGSVTLPNTPISGSVSVVLGGNYTIDSQDVDVTSLSSVAGNVVSLSGAAASTTYTVSYQYTAASRARVRSYLGAPGQTADATMISNLPGVWTSAHTVSGCAYLIVELDYDPDSFPSGIPNVSALVRGAKVYDTRTGVTAWSENPALLSRHAAIDPLCGRLSASVIDDTAISVAANVCDTSVSYVVNGQTYTRAKYTAGLTLKSGTRGQDALNDLAEAMCGKWAFIDGQLRVKAGAWITPLQTLDDTWLTDKASVQIQPKPNRADVINIVTGTYADEQSDYQVVQFPRVSAASYITEDGAELPIDLQLNAVTFVGQAQQAVATRLREARQGIRVTLACNLRAYQTEWGDVINVTLARFGWLNKPFEVLGTSFTLDGGIQLNLKETDSGIWDMGATFSAFDPAPNTFLPSPFDIPTIAGLSASSSDAVQQKNPDGTVVQRMRVSWTAIANPGVLGSGGGVEVRYGLLSQTQSAWVSVFAESGASQIDIPGVQQGQTYGIIARAYNALVNGRWTVPVVHVVGSRSVQIGTTGIVAGAITFVGEDYAAGPLTSDAESGAVTFTPAVNCKVVVTSNASWSYANSSGSIKGISVQVIPVLRKTSDNSVVTGTGTFGSDVFGVPDGQAAGGVLSAEQTFDVLAGVQYVAKTLTSRVASGGGWIGALFYGNPSFSAIRVKAEAIQR